MDLDLGQVDVASLEAALQWLNERGVQDATDLLLLNTGLDSEALDEFCQAQGTGYSIRAIQMAAAVDAPAAMVLASAFTATYFTGIFVALKAIQDAIKDD